MHPTAFLLALTAFLLWGCSPLFDKLGMRGLTPLAGLTVRVLAAAVLVGVYSIFAGTWKEIAAAPRPAIGYFILSGVCGAVLGQLAYYGALRYEGLTRVLLISSAYPLVAVALAILFLHEGLTVPRVVGGLLVVAGMVVIKGWG